MPIGEAFKLRPLNWRDCEIDNVNDWCYFQGLNWSCNQNIIEQIYRHVKWDELETRSSN